MNFNFMVYQFNTFPTKGTYVASFGHSFDIPQMPLMSPLSITRSNLMEHSLSALILTW